MSSVVVREFVCLSIRGPWDFLRCSLISQFFSHNVIAWCDLFLWRIHVDFERAILFVLVHGFAVFRAVLERDAITYDLLPIFFERLFLGLVRSDPVLGRLLSIIWVLGCDSLLFMNFCLLRGKLIDLYAYFDLGFLLFAMGYGFGSNVWARVRSVTIWTKF